MRKTLLKQEFDTAKLLLSKGMRNIDCAKTLDISAATVGRIKEAKDWNSYLAIKKRMSEYQKERYNAKKTAKTVTIEKKVPEPVVKVAETAQTNIRYKPDPMANNYQIHRLLEELKLQNEYLKQISAKLAFLVEELA